jgi:alpha,alpha-trehalase
VGQNEFIVEPVVEWKGSGTTMLRGIGSSRLVALFAAGLLIMPNQTGNASGDAKRQSSQQKQSFSSLGDILQYISDDWENLKRSLTDCKTYEDVKTEGEPMLYLPADVGALGGLSDMQQRCKVDVEHLPAAISEQTLGEIQRHGLLYLENPYVVPGGQFNEMYGWDSYFIIRGLLRDRRRDLAKGMVENFFYELEHYGGVLNANRTYYLGRSQPPFLTSMILAVFDADQASGQSDLAWLDKGYRFAVKDYEQWNREPHLAGDTGLSRYFDEGDGPVPEIMNDPSDYYRGVAQYFLMHEGENSPHLVRQSPDHPDALTIGDVYELPDCKPESIQGSKVNCSLENRFSLTADFYKGDRSMRESGFDVSFRFGPYSADTHRFAPVCLNSLLYKTEKDLEQMSRLLGHPDEASGWAHKAELRRARMVKYLWNGDRGLFFDYDFAKSAQSTYEYAATYYPLWVGLASKEQAQAVERNLPLFEQAGGLAMSRTKTEAQWDYPYGWAPIHLLAIEGLRRYGYDADADRVTSKFLAMILRNFRRDHTIREKYDVVAQSSVTHIVAGYSQNVTGFGWTNAVFLELLHESPEQVAAKLRALQ